MREQLGYTETLNELTILTNFDRAIAEARPLDALGRRILQPHERLDHGMIHYTTTADAVHEWANDPHGLRKLNFIADAYGIPREGLEDTLKDIGLGDYVRYKSEGRLVGQVSTQILKPTYYFMTNALILGYLTRHFNIPTALMVSTYETDTFSYNNADKTNALGTIEFPVGIETDSGRIQTVKIKLVPVGLRQPDGSVRSVDSNGLSGQRCCDIMVRVASASDAQNKPYPRRNNETQISAEDAEFYTLAALGITIQQETISLTDFYKQMWIAVINRLRKSGELPSERDMPMFFVSGEQVYSALPKLVNPPDLTCQVLGGVDCTGDRNHKKLNNGIVVRADTDVMIPAWYYPMEYGLPDIYFECSSCGGDDFVQQLARADRLLETHGLSTSEVRAPDREIPELERLVIHPSGSYIDMMSARADIERLTGEIIANIQRLKEDIAKKRIDRSSGGRQLEILVGELNKVRRDTYRELIRSIIENPPSVQRYTASHDVIFPEVVASTYRELIGRG